jgi:hypothetical protein
MGVVDKISIIAKYMLFLYTGFSMYLFIIGRKNSLPGFGHLTKHAFKLSTKMLNFMTL